MIKKNEIVKKSEAKIIVFLKNATGHMKRASNMSRKLSIDYIYLMKILREMYNKGWIATFKLNNITYFDTTKKAPVKEAIIRLTEPQTRLKIK